MAKEMGALFMQLKLPETDGFLMVIEYRAAMGSSIVTTLTFSSLDMNYLTLAHKSIFRFGVTGIQSIRILLFSEFARPCRMRLISPCVRIRLIASSFIVSPQF